MGQPKKQPSHPLSPAAERLAATAESNNDDDEFVRALKPLLKDAIQDIRDELDTVYDNISKTAREHIHSELASSHSH